jgi:hypothetical protein
MHIGAVLSDQTLLELVQAMQTSSSSTSLPGYMRVLPTRAQLSRSQRMSVASLLAGLPQTYQALGTAASTGQGSRQGSRHSARSVAGQATRSNQNYAGPWPSQADPNETLFRETFPDKLSMPNKLTRPGMKSVEDSSQKESNDIVHNDFGVESIIEHTPRYEHLPGDQRSTLDYWTQNDLYENMRTLSLTGLNPNNQEGIAAVIRNRIRLIGTLRDQYREKKLRLEARLSSNAEQSGANTARELSRAKNTFIRCLNESWLDFLKRLLACGVNLVNLATTIERTSENNGQSEELAYAISDPLIDRTTLRDRIHSFGTSFQGVKTLDPALRHFIAYMYCSFGCGLDFKKRRFLLLGEKVNFIFYSLGMYINRDQIFWTLKVSGVLSDYDQRTFRPTLRGSVPGLGKADKDNIAAEIGPWYLYALTFFNPHTGESEKKLG